MSRGIVNPVNVCTQSLPVSWLTHWLCKLFALETAGAGLTSASGSLLRPYCSLLAVCYWFLVHAAACHAAAVANWITEIPRQLSQYWV